MIGNTITCVNCSRTGQYTGEYIVCHYCGRSLYVKSNEELKYNGVTIDEVVEELKAAVQLIDPDCKITVPGTYYAS